MTHASFHLWSFSEGFSESLRGPNWGLFFVLKFVRSRGFWGEISSTVSKDLSDRKGPAKQKNDR